MKLIVVGGGISGLACAHFLRKGGHDVWLVEPHQPGGVMGSSRLDGFLCERGPQALLANAPAVQTLIDDLGLRARALAPRPEARRRRLYSRGRLHDVPMSPPALLGTSLLSWRGRLRLLGEPFVRRRPQAAASPETLRDFAARRLGAEAADRLLVPAVMAIYAGDARLLEAASAFPSLVEWERDHGSLLRGALATARRGRQQNQARPRGIVSFPEGLSELAAAITAQLGDRWVHGKATALARVGGGSLPGAWRVDIAGANDQDDGKTTLLEGDAVILACDRTASAGLLHPLAPEASRALREIPVAPTAVVHLGFRGPGSASTSNSTSRLGMDLDAYGFIAARGEGVHLLGCQYETSIFASRAPEDHVLLRAIVGGSFDPGALDLTDEALVSRTCEDLQRAAGLRQAPDFTAVWRHPLGIPQYTLGHAQRCATIAEGLKAHPGLFITGNALRGVGVADCIGNAEALAAQWSTSSVAPAG